jgi:hypothetical protein
MTQIQGNESLARFGVFRARCNRLATQRGTRGRATSCALLGTRAAAAKHRQGALQTRQNEKKNCAPRYFPSGTRRPPQASRTCW